MTFVITVPSTLAAAAGDVAHIGSEIGQVDAAAGPTTGVVAAAA